MTRPSLRRRVAPATLLSLAAGLAAAGCSAHAAPVPSHATLGASIRNVSAAQASAAVRKAWAANPALSTYSVQSVSYTEQSLTRILDTCEQGGAADDLAAFQSAKLTACAPLIFFLESYARSTNAPAVTDAATAVYNFAITGIIGPTDSRAYLNDTLKKWGLPVTAGRMPAAASEDPAAVLERQVLSIYDTMLRESSVEVSINRSSAKTGKSLSRTTAVLGPTEGSTEFRTGAATAVVTVLNSKLYLTGTGGGLTSLLGLPEKIAAKAAGRPIVLSSPDAPYSTLSEADSLAALPAQILPATDSVQVAAGPAQTNGEKLRTLTWTTQSSTASPRTVHILYVRDSSIPLPVELIESSSGQRQVTQFAYWGGKVSITPPTHAVSYTSLTK